MKIIWLVFALSILLPASVKAAELVMFESPFCEWCDVWNEEVGGVYGKTPEARIAPLRRVDIEDPRPRELKGIKRVVYTPTFVLVSDGREVGRITGYPGESNFWGLLGALMEDLENDVNGCPDEKDRLANSKPKRNSPAC